MSATKRKGQLCGREAPSHGGIMGSSPVGVTTKRHTFLGVSFACTPTMDENPSGDAHSSLFRRFAPYGKSLIFFERSESPRTAHH